MRSLEICGGGLTDAGVKNIKDLSSLSLLNLSQNCNLTDKTLEMISGKLCSLSLGCGWFNEIAHYLETIDNCKSSCGDSNTSSAFVLLLQD